MKNKKFIRFFSEKRVPLIWFLLVVVLSSFFVLSSFVIQQGSRPQNQTIITSNVGTCTDEMSLLREKSSSLISPLLLSDLLVQDRKMSGLKNSIEDYLQTQKSAGVISSASIYVRKLNNGSWISIGENETYNPASLMKVAYLISFLKEAEARPELLNQKYFFAQPFTGGNSPNIVSFKLTPGKYYSVKELLEAMIMYSDNDATGLLSQNLNKLYFNKVFSDLGLSAPPDKGEYFIGVADYSKLFRVLYNATYLNAAYSEYAIKVLLQSNYRDGICARINPSVRIAHKFGERVLNQVAQLHEFGIFYVGNEPYILGVMTKGNNLEALRPVLTEIGEMTYNYMLQRQSI